MNTNEIWVKQSTKNNDNGSCQLTTSNLYDQLKKTRDMINGQNRSEISYQMYVGHLKHYFQNYHLDHRFYNRW